MSPAKVGLALILFLTPLRAQLPTLRPLVNSGMKVSGAEPGKLGTIGAATQNDAGCIVFNALLAGSERVGGIFQFDGTSVSSLVLYGLASPLGGTIQGSYKPTLTEDGSVYFIATLSGTAPVNALCRYSERSFEVLAYDGQMVKNPDLLIGAIEDFDVSNDGWVVFQSHVTRLGVGNTTGIFAISDGVIVPLVIGEDEVAPENWVLLPASPRINSHGDLVFVDQVQRSPSGNTIGSRVLRRDPSGWFSTIFSLGAADSGLGAVTQPECCEGVTISNLTDPGTVLLSSSSGAEANSTRELSLLRLDSPGNLDRLNAKIDSVTVLSYEFIQQNLYGTVVAIALVRPISENNSSPLQRVVLIGREGGLAAVVREHDRVNTGAIIARIGSLSLGNSDRVLLTADTLDGTSGIYEIVGR